MQTVFDAAGARTACTVLLTPGISGLWRRRRGPCFQSCFPQHVERLAAYWAEALGGPTTYSDSYGDETTVVKMHSGNGEHDEMNRRAIVCFDLALSDYRLANDDVLRQVLHDYSRGRPRQRCPATTSPPMMCLTPSIPHWSWTDFRSNTPPPQLRTFILSIVANALRAEA